MKKQKLAHSATWLLDGAGVRSVLNWPDAIAAVREAFVAAARHRTLAGTASQVAPRGGLLHLKAGGFAEPPLITVKANLRPEGACAFGVVLVFDHRDQSLCAILDSTDLTAIRTAATAVVATQVLGARDDPTIAVIGAGPVGHRVVEALSHGLSPGTLQLWSRDPRRARELASAAPAELPSRVYSTPTEAVAAADVVITCTPSRDPLIAAPDLREDALVLAMGADSPGKRELASDVLAQATVIADDPIAALRVGESAYLPQRAEAPLDLGSVLLAGSAFGRAGQGGESARRLVFDSVGTAFTDTAVASVIVRHATERGVGSHFRFRDPEGWAVTLA